MTDIITGEAGLLGFNSSPKIPNSTESIQGCLLANVTTLEVRMFEAEKMHSINIIRAIPGSVLCYAELPHELSPTSSRTCFSWSRSRYLTKEELEVYQNAKGV